MRSYNLGSINDNAGDDIVQAPTTAILAGMDTNSLSGTFGYVKTPKSLWQLDRDDPGPASPTKIAASQGGFWVNLGASGSSGSPRVRNILWVDPDAGDDATAIAGSLDRQWKNIQAALNAATPGQTVALPGGIYDLGSTGLVWPPFVPNVTLWGFPPRAGAIDAADPTSNNGGARILNDGTLPVLEFDVNSFGMSGAIANITFGRRFPAPGVYQPTLFFGAGALATDTKFSLDNCTVFTPRTPGGIEPPAQGLVVSRFNSFTIDGGLVQSARFFLSGSINVTRQAVVTFTNDSMGGAGSIEYDPTSLPPFPLDPCTLIVSGATTRGVNAKGRVDVVMDPASVTSTLIVDHTGFGNVNPQNVNCPGAAMDAIRVTMNSAGTSVDLTGVRMPGGNGDVNMICAASGAGNYPVTADGVVFGGPGFLRAMGFIALSARDIPMESVDCDSAGTGTIDRDSLNGQLITAIAAPPYNLPFLAGGPNVPWPAGANLLAFATEVLAGVGTVPVTTSPVNPSTGFDIYGANNPATFNWRVERAN